MFSTLSLSCILVLCSSLVTSFPKFPQAFQQSDSLRLVILVHRHGHRSPLSFMEQDPYADPKFWPDGLSRLLPEGKQQMYQLGVDFRQFYSNFLTESPVEVQARSSDADRCLQSALLLLYGLYKAQDEWSFDRRIDYQPIPVHTKPGDTDEMLNESVDCPTIDEELKRLLFSEEASRFMQNYNETIAILKEKYRKKNLNLAQIVGILDEYAAEKMRHYPQPGWVTSKILKDLKELADFYAYLQNASPVILRLRVSAFFNDVKKKIISLISKTEKNLKLLIYSTHDTYIGAFMNALKIFNNLRVPTAATLVFELHEPKSEDFRLKIFYKNVSSSAERHPLRPPYCSDPEFCPVNEFFSHINKFITNSWSSECKLAKKAEISDMMSSPVVPLLNLSSQSSDSYQWSRVFMIAIGFLMLALVLIVLIMSTLILSNICFRKGRCRQDYNQIY